MRKHKQFSPQVESLEQILSMDSALSSPVLAAYPGPLPTATVTPTDVLSPTNPTVQQTTTVDLETDYIPPAAPLSAPVGSNNLPTTPTSPIVASPYVPLIGPSQPSDPLPVAPAPAVPWYVPYVMPIIQLASDVITNVGNSLNYTPTQPIVPTTVP